MAAKNKPYEQFGPYILFKKLESDSLSELWRAARIDGGSLGPLVALRRFTGGNRDALTSAAHAGRNVVAQLTGTSFVKHQVIDAVGNIAFVAHDYDGGRSLRHIADRARGAAGTSPNPIPLDQAIVIAEKVALSLATTEDYRVDGARLAHGALIPQLIWITDDGEIRVAGQGLGSGLVASLKDARVAAELGRWVAPEMQQSGVATKASEVFSMGALLYLLVTGVEPPDATTASAFMQSVGAAKTPAGTPIPDDIRAIVNRSLTIDPSMRYASMADMKQAISALAHGGKYSATTFNLAFYVSSLLKKELEGETVERDKELKVNVAAYAEAAPVAASAAPSSPMFAAGTESTSKSKAPLAIAAAVVIAAVGVGGYFMYASKSKGAAPAPKQQAVTTAQMIPQKKAIVTAAPLVAAAPTSATTTAAPTSADEAGRKKAFEDAVQQKLQEEMMKLQQDYTKSLQKSQSKNAPVQVATPAPAPVPQRPTEEAPSAAALDQQRLAARPEPQPAQQAPILQQPQQQQQAPAVVEQQAPVHVVHEGDVVDVSDLDTAPHVIRQVAPSYPPMAVRQRAEATILVTALVNENGDVVDVKVLRGDKRFGFEDSALRAVRATKFSAPVKDGKRVKSWFAVPIIFKQ
ncbi:MAG TPA: TonB family protein [Thermoanaerobaculia bacterium]|jgi:protein TonB